MGKTVISKQLELSNKESINYLDSGNGDVLVLLHGNMTSSYHLLNFIKTLPDNIRVIAPDLRGFGQSSYKKAINSLADFSNDIHDLLNKIGVEKYAIAGWSMGGSVAMQHAIDYSDKVSRLILISSVAANGYPLRQGGQGDYLATKQEMLDDVILAPVTAAFTNKDKDFIRTLWDMSVYNHNKPNENDYLKLIDDILTQVNIVDVYYALTHFNITDTHNGVSEGTKAINQIKAPVLILHGEDDLVVPVTTAEQNKELLQNTASSVQFSAYSKCGHSLFIDDPDTLRNQIVEFII